MTSVLVRGGELVSPEAVLTQDVLIVDGRIAEVGREVAAPEGAEVIDASGLYVFSSLTDSQVHFREPGLEYKEDLASGSLAAAAGGISAFMEMPNTKPATSSPEALQEKIERARATSWVDFAFFLGATAENADRLGEWEGMAGCAGVKVFMGSSTGNLLIPDDATLERVLRSGERRVAVHSEDEVRLAERYKAIPKGAGYETHPDVRDVETAVRSTRRLLDLVEKTGRKVHLLHVSTAEEIELLRERDLGDLVTVEVTPNHLFLHAPDCYLEHGAKAQMNPPVRELRHQEVLRQAVVDRVVSCIGSDHAPHTLEEKQRPFPEAPSGIPGVQTSLGLLFTAVRDGWLELTDIARLLSSGPAAVYGIAGKGAASPGMDGDLTLVDPCIAGPLELDWLRSKAGYSPYVGLPLAGWPVRTLVRGATVYAGHRSVGRPRGRPLGFR